MNTVGVRSSSFLQLMVIIDCGELQGAGMEYYGVCTRVSWSL